jgi:hypothetical protein
MEYMHSEARVSNPARRPAVLLSYSRLSLDPSENYGIPLECSQCYCGGIRQMLTFVISLSSPKGHRRPDHSRHIVQYHIKNILKPRTFVFTVSFQQLV